MADAQHSSGSPLWGVSAEFDTSDAMVAALLALRDRGLGRLDAYSPVPIAAAAAALKAPRQPVFPFGVGAAFLGAGAMFGLCTYGTIVGYRFNIGGRPLFSWPSFVVPSVSFGCLLGALTVFGVMLALSRLPRLNHPAFNIPYFTRVTENRFFVAVEAGDESFDAEKVEDALTALTMQPRRISRVPR